MSSLRSITGNTLLLSIAQVVNPLTSVLLVSAIARLKGAEALGEYSLVLTIFYMAVDFAGLGLHTPITRAVTTNKEKASDFLVVASLIGLATGVLAIAGVQMLALLLDYSTEIRSSTSLILWAVVPSVLIVFYEAIFLAFQKVQYIAGLSIVENLCKVAIGVFLLSKDADVLSLFFVIVALRFLMLVAYLSIFNAVIARIAVRFSRQIVSELWKVSPVFTGNLLIGALFGRVDVLVLSKLGTMADVGYYSAALRFIDIARLIPISFNRAAFPVFCEFYATDRDSCRQLFLRSVSYLIVLGFGSALGIYFLADFLVTTVYGPDMEEAVGILRIMALLMIPASLSPTFAALLFAAKYERLDLFSNVIKFVVFVILCIVLTSSFFKSGTAVALVVSELVLSLLLGFFLMTNVFDLNLFGSFTRAFLTAALVFFLTYALALMSPVLAGVVVLPMYLFLTLLFHSDMRTEVFALGSVFWRSLGYKE